MSKVDTVVRETGNMFAVCLEGLRKTHRVQDWWDEYLRQWIARYVDRGA